MIPHRPRRARHAPDPHDVDLDVLARCVEALVRCAQACTTCTDACLELAAAGLSHLHVRASGQHRTGRGPTSRY